MRLLMIRLLCNHKLMPVTPGWRLRLTNTRPVVLTKSRYRDRVVYFLSLKLNIQQYMYKNIMSKDISFFEFIWYSLVLQNLHCLYYLFFYHCYDYFYLLTGLVIGVTIYRIIVRTYPSKKRKKTTTKNESYTCTLSNLIN